MRRILAALPLLALLLALAVPARPATPDPAETFTPAQRAEIVRLLREALKRDPSILRDAIMALQADEGLRHDSAARAAITASRQALIGDPRDAVAGNPSGDVTVVEFYDVRCPYCRRMLPVTDQLLSHDHGVRLVLKDLPILGPPSVLGARALLAAERQGGYFKLHDVLMRSPEKPTEATLRTQVEGLGLDWARLQRDMADPVIQQKIDTNLALAHALGIDGTPAFVIGDKLLPGAMELADLQQAVAGARAEPQ
jgi:protein-disulfide isomerase